MEGQTSEFPVQLLDDFAHILGCRSRDDDLGSPLTIMPQLPIGATYSLLGVIDGLDCVISIFLIPKFSWMILAEGAEQLVVQEALLTILKELYFSWFTLITNMETSTEGAGMMTLLASPFM